ncbi:MAG: hypothetical protein LBH74_09865 [Nitrososphaerota archaeon]|nr:hypothetical protein [Nitrososphaerota archaeon]
MSLSSREGLSKAIEHLCAISKRTERMRSALPNISGVNGSFGYKKRKGVDFLVLGAFF